MGLREKMLEIDMDADGTIMRFGGNEELLIRFIKKFLEDPTFVQVQNAVKQKNYEDMECAAHTLKGTSANLGFDRLSSLCNLMVQKLRAGERGSVSEIFIQIEQEYSKIISWIHNFNR
jgi:HPt (histidine-containing phosphotransfer) domain-containing protein